ncbi:hypothetical protein BL864_005536, partial [Escherichia coli]|nr:hypothetical protein [Escherichia coli]
MRTRTGPLEGWRLLGLLAGALMAMAVAIWAVGGLDVEATRLVIRATARSSLLLFLLAFVASSAVQLWPGEATRWLLRNRRYFGLAFAFSHGIHAVAIIALAAMDQSLFLTLTNT